MLEDGFHRYGLIDAMVSLTPVVTSEIDGRNGRTGDFGYVDSTGVVLEHYAALDDLAPQEGWMVRQIVSLSE